MAKAKTPSLNIDIPGIQIHEMSLGIAGDTPLICHAWSERSIAEMMAKQTKQAKAAKDAKDPDLDFRESLYLMPDGQYGFPAIAFKKAAVDACRFLDSLKMTEARGAFFILGELVPIVGKPRMRRDMVRLNGIKADIRFRAEFPTWRTEIRIRFSPSKLSASQIAHLMNLAGFHIGVGERRPETEANSFGQFHITSGQEMPA